MTATKTIVFDRAAVLPASEALARWTMNLSLAWEDVKLANERLLESIAAHDLSRELADARTVAGFVWEAAKLLREGAKVPEIDAFVRRLPQNAQADYRAVLQHTSTADNAAFAARLVQARDKWAHYERLDGKRLRRAMVASPSPKAYVTVGPQFRQLTLPYAHTVAAELFFEQGDRDQAALERFLTELAELVTALMRFIYEVVARRVVASAASAPRS